MANTATEKRFLSKFISNLTGNVFVVTVPEHLTGALYARYSRAETGLRETLLNEFLDSSGKLKIAHGSKLMERILIEYGDDSVAELESLHLSFEQISNLATKKIEDKRIGGSPIEQSSRYVFYDQKNKDGQYKYLREKRILESRFASQYIETMDLIFDTYSALVNVAMDYFKRQKPIENAQYAVKADDNRKYKLAELTQENEVKGFQRAYKFDIKSKACDTIRCILPASTLTNVGVHGNGRFFQGLLTSLYTDNLSEMKELGRLAHEELNKFIPIYVKRAGFSNYKWEKDQKTISMVNEILMGIPIRNEKDEVTLLTNNKKDYFNNLLAQVMYEYSNLPLRQLRDIAGNLGKEKKLELFNTYIGKRQNRRHKPGRALEFGYPFTFDILADFGIYRDLHRERMKTQQRQHLTTVLGRVIPKDIQEMGNSHYDKVLECFERSESLYDRLLPEYWLESQYVVLFGHKIRWCQGSNLRESMHELELRTIPQGHPSYRKICQQMHSKIIEMYPDLKDSMKFVDYNNYIWTRSDSEARQSRKSLEMELRNETG